MKKEEVSFELFIVSYNKQYESQRTVISTERRFRAIQIARDLGVEVHYTQLYKTKGRATHRLNPDICPYLWNRHNIALGEFKEQIYLGIKRI